MPCLDADALTRDLDGMALLREVLGPAGAVPSVEERFSDRMPRQDAGALGYATATFRKRPERALADACA